jgi:hypothetical protein
MHSFTCLFALSLSVFTNQKNIFETDFNLYKIFSKFLRDFMIEIRYLFRVPHQNNRKVRKPSKPHDTPVILDVVPISKDKQ